MFGLIVLGLTIVAAACLLGFFAYQTFQIQEEYDRTPPKQVFIDCYRQIKRDRMKL